VSSANLPTVFELDLATQSSVYREYSRGLRTQPWGDPVFRERGLEVSAHPDDLGPGGLEVQDPGTQGGVQSQLNQLARHSEDSQPVSNPAPFPRGHVAAVVDVVAHSYDPRRPVGINGKGFLLLVPILYYLCKRRC